MDTLPPEIIGEILNKVDRPDLCATSSISQLWHELTLLQIVKIRNRNEFRKAAFQGDAFVKGAFFESIF